MEDYAIEQDEVRRMGRRTLSQAKPVVVSEMPREKRKKKRRKRRSLSTHAVKRIRKLERQATGVMRDAPPNVVALRRKPRIPTREPKLYDYGIKEDTRTNQEIVDEFLS